ncbi:MAG: sulfatase [Caldilineaceae bacterium]|nr:sulfatase [Caldilineaceae bacterium]MCB0120824.1 sulfatase [Caldilineaceae bacterium]
MQRPNFLLVILDATRADACSCYAPFARQGARQPTTPHLDRLAASSILYEQAGAAAPWTLPALASILTGLYPSQSAIYEQRVLSNAYPTLFQLLGAAGYATFAIGKNSWLSKDFGLTRGVGQMHRLWQYFQSEEEITIGKLAELHRGRSLYAHLIRELLGGNVLKNALNLVYHRYWNRVDDGAVRMTQPVMRWVAAQQQPWFAMVHFLEAHLPYQPPREWIDRFAQAPEQAVRLSKRDQWRLAWRHIAHKEQLSDTDLQAWRDLYLAEVAYQDHYLGQLLAELEQAGQLANTCVIVVADHGENLGEHCLLNHQYSLHETLLHVPLLIRLPEQLSPAAQRVRHPVQTLDLFRTILDLATIPAPHESSRNLLPGAEPRPYVIAEYGRPQVPHAALLARYDLQPADLQPFSRGFRSLRTDERKLIESSDGTIELYDLDDDPGELVNLAASEPAALAALQQQLRAWEAAHGALEMSALQPTLQVDDALRARLQALGYLD